MNKTFFPKTKLLSFVLIIPIINALAYISTNYFPRETINPGNTRAFILIIFCVYFIFKGYPNNKSSKAILIFIIYMFILSFFSTNYYNTFYRTFQVFISSTLFVVGFYYIRNIELLERLNKIYILIFLLLISTFFISNFFGVGYISYSDKNSILFGATSVHLSEMLSVFLLMSPLFYFFSNSKCRNRIVGIISAIAFVIILLAMKRSALLSLIIGFIVYFLVSKQKIKILKYIVLFSFILTIFSPLFLENISERYMLREKRMPLTGKFNVEEEGRYHEFLLVIHDFENRHLLNILFGQELFNEFSHYNIQRMFHTDYMSLISGGGIVGLFFYLYIYFAIYKEQRKYLSLTHNRKFANELFAVSLSLIVACFILAVSGFYHNIDLRSFIFMYLGAITGVLRGLYFESQKNSGR